MENEDVDRCEDLLERARLAVGTDPQMASLLVARVQRILTNSEHPQPLSRCDHCQEPLNRCECESGVEGCPVCGRRMGPGDQRWIVASRRDEALRGPLGVCSRECVWWWQNNSVPAAQEQPEIPTLPHTRLGGIKERLDAFHRMTTTWPETLNPSDLTDAPSANQLAYDLAWVVTQLEDIQRKFDETRGWQAQRDQVEARIIRQRDDAIARAERLETEWAANRDALTELAVHAGAKVEWDSEGMPSLTMGRSMKRERDQYREALRKIAQEPAPGTTVSCRRIAREVLYRVLKGERLVIPDEPPAGEGTKQP